MAKDEPQALCDRLFSTFLAPLVLGGEMRPIKAFGGKNALSIGERTPADSDALSRTQLARVRIARKLVPATHPGFNAVFRRSGPLRILSVIEKTLERVAPPRTAGEALSRHTWLSR